MTSADASAPSSRTGVRRPRPALGQRASLWVSAAVAAHTLWTSAAPALTYRVLASEWHLTHSTTTAIFAIYPVVVVATLVLSWDLSDHVGRRTAMLLGVSASILGAAIFALAPSVAWLFAGRSVMGVGVGLSAGPSTAAVVEFSGPGASHRAASVTTAAQCAGFSVALLLGGAMVQYAPWPTHLCVWVLVVALAPLFGLTWFLPSRHAGPGRNAWRPKLPAVPRPERLAFAGAALAVMTAFTHGVVILSIGGQIAHDLVGSANALVDGAVLASFPVAAGLVGVAARRLPTRRAMMLGALASGIGMLLLEACLAWHAIALYLAATATAGIGYSLLFVSGLETLNAKVSSEHRGGAMSALYLLGYLAMASFAVALGLLATAKGLRIAIDLGATAIGASSLATFAIARTSRPGTAADTECAEP